MNLMDAKNAYYENEIKRLKKENNEMMEFCAAAEIDIAYEEVTCGDSSGPDWISGGGKVGEAVGEKVCEAFSGDSISYGSCCCCTTIAGKSVVTTSSSVVTTSSSVVWGCLCFETFCRIWMI
ncbi:hypothetical protein LWI28_015477 [Acer negundo]|uniref:Uncharacterized protein n=1 Tax=Acer negundo TaxID=4023 RepID=A0AAD5I6T7_ACENE|nr:hypothetical protein LWI28_015477 [Acer negundo]